MPLNLPAPVAAYIAAENGDDVTALAERHGFALADTVQMPANNLSVIFRREFLSNPCRRN